MLDARMIVIFRRLSVLLARVHDCLNFPWCLDVLTILAQSAYVLHRVPLICLRSRLTASVRTLWKDYSSLLHGVAAESFSGCTKLEQPDLYGATQAVKNDAVWAAFQYNPYPYWSRRVMGTRCSLIVHQVKMGQACSHGLGGPEVNFDTVKMWTLVLEEYEYKNLDTSGPATKCYCFSAG